MNKHQVKLADGSYATRNSKTRIYTHATIMRVGESFDPSSVAPGASAMYRDRRPGDEVVLAWHMTREAASRYLHSAASERERVFYRASVRFATVELLEEPRKATCVNTEEPVSCLHKQGTPTKGSTMNKHEVKLANGVVATRNSANRVYTHATVVTVGEGYEDDYHRLQAGDEFVLVWHMTREAAVTKARSSDAQRYVDRYKGSVRVVEVELLPAKARKAPSAKKAVVEAPVEVQEVQEAPAQAPVEAMPADSQDVAEEAQEEAAPAAKKQTTRMLKVECPEGSGYKVRLARSWLDSFGAPSCPCHSAVMIGA